MKKDEQCASMECDHAWLCSFFTPASTWPCRQEQARLSAFNCLSQSNAWTEHEMGCRLAEQDKWLHEQIEDNKGEPYWDFMDALLKQFDGMIDGYQQASRDGNPQDLPMLEREDFQFVINNGAQSHDAVSALFILFKSSCLPVNWLQSWGHFISGNALLRRRAFAVICNHRDLAS